MSNVLAERRPSMNIISAIIDRSDAAIIRELTNEFYPDATYIDEISLPNVSVLIKDLQPTVVWLQASPEGIELAEKAREMSPETNLIFISPDGNFAYDALRVRASGYIQRPVTQEDVKEELLHLRYPVNNSDPGIYVRCLDGFDVFCDNKPVRFSRTRSKEALAYLIHRKGFMCSVSELCGILWGSERIVDTNLKSQCRVVMSSLRKDLEGLGADGILTKSWNRWGIDTSKVTCDYYDLQGQKDYDPKIIRESYMPQYPWAKLYI